MANRLCTEKSPYLLQHKDNPVNWYPWCKEAFQKAQEEDKPIFLSIGYSTCHWCHVMAHESFEDSKTAELLEPFVCIKVDREERPDIDAVYMDVCQALTGSGGWPLTIFMTPDKKPFFAGTYFPKTSRYGQPGLHDLLQQITLLWKTDRDNLLASSEQITAAIQHSHTPSGGTPDRALIRKGYHMLRIILILFGEDSDRPLNSRHLTTFFFSCASVSQKKNRKPCRWRNAHCRPCQRAESSTTSAAVSRGIPPMKSGWCRILKRCCMTMRC